ncbi:MAG: hypothetical protein ABSA11_12935 [Candidatus Bathyarchaeia archaeon]|jgi:hypothetical protein
MEELDNVDPDWKGLYRAGGIAAFIIGVLCIIDVALAATLGSPPSTGEEYLKYFIGIVLQARVADVLIPALTDLLLIPVALALYLVLRGVDRNAMLVTTVFTGLFIALDLGTSTLNTSTLITLSVQYAATTSDAQRAAFVAAADYAAVSLAVSSPIYSFVVPCLGFIITNLVMLRGVFSRAVAYLGIVASVAGIVGGISSFVFYPFYVPLIGACLIILGVWSILVGVRLYGLGKR